MPTFLALCLLLTASANAQIYADFTVSSGGNPLGVFRVLLEHEKAPRSCANFIGLASGRRPWIDVTNGAVRTNTPFYDGLTFHRLIHNFVIQGGSPNGQGTDGPGYSILDEYHPDLRHSSQYKLSMAKSSLPNTGGSQFFITLAETSGLNDKHSVFGTVISGTDVIDGFKNADAFPASPPPAGILETPVNIDSVVISGPDYAAFDLELASLRLPHVSATQLRPIRDAASGNFSIRLDRKAKTNYFFTSSENLKDWISSGNVLGLSALGNFGYNYGSVPAPKFFVNCASTDYSQIPNAPGNLVSASRAMRILYPNGLRLDLMFSPGGGTWEYSDQAGTQINEGAITASTWNDQAGESGFINNGNPQDHRLPLGQLFVDFDKLAGPKEILFLDAWLSFHTENTGWLEEFAGSAPIRLPFEILSN